MATPNAASMADFFDFGEAALPDVSAQDIPVDITTPHPDGSFLDTTTESQVQDAIGASNADFNTDFSSWLPRYQKPAHPCDYCRSKSLECFIYNADGSGQNVCSPCNALFRPCSFSSPEKMAARKQRTALDTLEFVPEDEQREVGGLTGRKQMRSLGHIGPIQDDNDEEGLKKGAIRFSKEATKILKEWMLTNIDHPYPTDEQKELLKEQTGLNIGQISNWMANTRRRRKARPKRSASPSIRPSTAAIDIPAGRTWDSLNPLERWKVSPPQNEPAPMDAIADAVKMFDPPETTSVSSSYRKDNSNESTGSISLFRAPSISSLETGLTNMSSGSLGSHSAYSHGSRHSLGSMNSLRSKERRRRRKMPSRISKADTDQGTRLFQCTFCTDRFKSKYDWSRHEKSLHLSLEKWLCAPIGEIVADKATGKPKCVYCDALEPSSEHLATHNHSACFEKGPESRIFYRKDHLRQHLRLMHGCKMTASMESWKSEAQYIKSRCGFCGMKFDKWQDRIDHLAKEFRNGADMKNWKGCRGLDPHVAIHVTNAMPPYLIANESKSPFPFSASNSSSMIQNNMHLESQDLEWLIPNTDQNVSKDLFVAYEPGRDPSSVGPIVLTTPKHYAANEAGAVNTNATCWEILTLRLGRFARQYIEQHGSDSITDEMLQKESRRILYGGPDDPWHQTAADNPEWLNLFKKAHGIDSKATVASGIQHHDVYEDLGINPNTTVDQSFDIDNFACAALEEDDPNRVQAFECSLAGSTRMTSHAQQLSSGQQSPLVSSSTSASSPARRAPLGSPNRPFGVYERISELACSTPGGPCYGENGELGFATKSFGSLHRKTYWAQPSTTTTTALPLLAPEPQTTTPPAPTTTPFDFPSWDQLPLDLQNPTTSADYHSSIPISAATMDLNMLSSHEIDTAPPLTDADKWDDAEMNFEMDLDLDLDMGMGMDMDLDLGGKF